MAKTRKKDNALDLLKQDHKEVDGLFKEFEKLEEDRSEEAVEQVIATACTELKIHDRLEAEVFYPAVREQADEELRDLLDEAEVEHTSVRNLIQTIEGMSAGDEKRNAHFTVLMEYVKHHVKEEEKEMFPMVKKLDLDLQQLGQQLKERKAELMSEMGVEMEEESETESA